MPRALYGWHGYSSMTKGSQLFVLLISLSAFSACTAQRLFKNEIYLLNNCGQTLQIVVANDSNIGLPERTLAITPGTRELIGFYNSYGEDVIGQIQDSYKLTIATNHGASQQVDGSTLRSHLRHIEKLDEGSTRQWIVDDRSFCPSNGTSAP